MQIHHHRRSHCPAYRQTYSDNLNTVTINGTTIAQLTADDFIFT